MGDTLKERVGAEIAKRVEDRSVLGVGTGSTVDAAIRKIGERVDAEGLVLKAVASSLESARLCEDVGITVLHSGYRARVDFGFDGADAVDRGLRAIKGKGGAMLREKILAARCSNYVLIIDESKLTDDIATKCTVPIEVIPEALDYVIAELAELGAGDIQLREAVKKHGAVITEFGNFIVDVRFAEITNAHERNVKAITGVVESGLFLSQANEALVARDDGIESIVL